MRKIIITALLSISWYATNLLAVDKQSTNIYLPYLQVGGARLFKVDSDTAATTLDFFVPLWQTTLQLFFTSIRLYKHDIAGKEFESNVHLGYRHLSSRNQYLHGIYGTFDRKRSSWGHYFNQLTIGGEMWLNKLFIGGNFYQPVDKKSRLNNKTKLAKVTQINSTYKSIAIDILKEKEKALQGADIEVGYEAANGLIGYLGGYYFQGKNVQSINGPRARLSYDFSVNGQRCLGIFDKIGLEVGIQRDKPRGTLTYLSANFRIDLSANQRSRLQGVARHMVDPVHRDVDIILNTYHKTESSPYSQNGKIVKIRESSNKTELSTAAMDPETDIIVAKHITAAELTKMTKNQLILQDTLTIEPGPGEYLAVDFGNIPKVIIIKHKTSINDLGKEQAFVQPTSKVFMQRLMKWQRSFAEQQLESIDTEPHESLSSNLNWLPLAGVIISAAGITYIMTRNNNNDGTQEDNKDDTSTFKSDTPCTKEKLVPKKPQKRSFGLVSGGSGGRIFIDKLDYNEEQEDEYENIPTCTRIKLKVDQFTKSKNRHKDSASINKQDNMLAKLQNSIQREPQTNIWVLSSGHNNDVISIDSSDYQIDDTALKNKQEQLQINETNIQKNKVILNEMANKLKYYEKEKAHLEKKIKDNAKNIDLKTQNNIDKQDQLKTNRKKLHEYIETHEIDAMVFQDNLKKYDEEISTAADKEKQAKIIADENNTAIRQLSNVLTKLNQLQESKNELEKQIRRNETELEEQKTIVAQETEELRLRKQVKASMDRSLQTANISGNSKKNPHNDVNKRDSK